jgi:hypothetical protein
MPNNNLTVHDVKVFVPALDFEESLRFYQTLGWHMNFKAENNAIAELELGNGRFLLQNFYNKELAENFILHIGVADAAAWHKHAANVIKTGQYTNARLTEPKKESYGALVTYVWDPSGVLLHFVQHLDENT